MESNKSTRAREVAQLSTAQSTRPEKSVTFWRAFLSRRPKGGGRRCQERWKLASMLIFEISSNFVVQAAPNGKSWFLARNFKAVFQSASHLLPRKQEVRLREAQSTTTVVQPIFCISPKAKLLNFQEESDNFFARMLVCPKAITT